MALGIVLLSAEANYRQTRSIARLVCNSRATCWDRWECGSGNACATQVQLHWLQ